MKNQETVILSKNKFFNYFLFISEIRDREESLEQEVVDSFSLNLDDGILFSVCYIEQMFFENTKWHYFYSDNTSEKVKYLFSKDVSYDHALFGDGEIAKRVIYSIYKNKPCI